MKLSVIIVNHNQRDLLKLTLNSLIKSSKTIDIEYIMVDNASDDASPDMVSVEFPEVKIITHIHNVGIAKAFNAGISAASGAYVLLVNSDIICGIDTLARAVEFKDENDDISGLSVRMLDAHGSFLPESNRGLTRQWAGFFKLTGLAKHFVKSRISDRNHKAWVEEFKTSEIDILADGFMLIRRSVFNEVGLFDERFMQFGHNIDFSYRMRLAGHKNYYYPKTYIINFKSGFYPKFTWQYIKNFYGAMLIFAFKYLFSMPEIKIIHGIPVYPPAYEVKQ